MERRSEAIASKQPACSQRRIFWYTASQGGRSLGSMHQVVPARTSQRRALQTFRIDRGNAGGVGANQCQVGLGEIPFFTTDISGVGLALTKCAASLGVQPEFESADAVGILMGVCYSWMFN